MAVSDNPFTGFTADELAELRAAYKQCLLDIASAGQSYTMGRTFTRANLTEVKKIMADITTAIKIVNGSGKTMVTARVCP